MAEPTTSPARSKLLLKLTAASLAVGALAWVLLRANPDPTVPQEGSAPSEEQSGGVPGPVPSAPMPTATPRAVATPGEPGAPRPAEEPAARVPGPAALPEAGPSEPPPPGSGSASPGAASDTPPASESRATANKEDIRDAIRAIVPEVRACFEQGLMTNPDLEGLVRVDFTLSRAPDGGAYAREGEIGDSTLKAPLVEACILTKLQAAHFKDLQGEGEVRVRYPFKMMAGGGFGGSP